MKRLQLIALVLCTCTIALAQQKVVTGVVTDALDGLPLPGVNIIEKGANHGVVTNSDGQYQIEVAGPESVLSFSYVGMLNEEVAVGNQTVIDTKLSQNVEQLAEVIVVGYGKRKRSEINGSIASINTEELEKISVSSLDAALSGMA
ncbi:MAG: hypothetical protein HC896_16580, partial [Bacteroidales bacterium]|nr:hypothetical protein [Bacteroidales bacterium]